MWEILMQIEPWEEEETIKLNLNLFLLRTLNYY